MAAYATKAENDAFSNTVYLEDQLVQQALENKGLKVNRVAWDNPSFDWSSTRYILFRSTWDYYYREAEFTVWLNKVKEKTTMINSEALIRWNIDKRYLIKLHSNGINIAPTFIIEQGNHTTLAELLDKHQLDTFVLKPLYSGGARHTYRIHKSEISQFEAIFEELIAQEPMMIQTFQNNIINDSCIINSSKMASNCEISLL